MAMPEQAVCVVKCHLIFGTLVFVLIILLFCIIMFDSVIFSETFFLRRTKEEGGTTKL